MAKLERGDFVEVQGYSGHVYVDVDSDAHGPLASSCTRIDTEDE